VPPLLRHPPGAERMEVSWTDDVRHFSRRPVDFRTRLRRQADRPPVLDASSSGRRLWSEV